MFRKIMTRFFPEKVRIFFVRLWICWFLVNSQLTFIALKNGGSLSWFLFGIALDVCIWALILPDAFYYARFKKREIAICGR